MPLWLGRLIRLALGGTGLGLGAATWFYVVTRLAGAETPFPEVVLFIMPFWYLWAAYTPAVLWMARRYPLRPGRLVAPLLRHIAFLIPLAFAHTALRFSLQPQLRASLQAGGGTHFDLGNLERLLGFAAYEAPVHLFVYGAIIGVAYLVEYTRRLRERELATARLSAQLARAQVQALRMQLNPHFLFNALNGVATLVRDGEQERAVRMLVDLGDLLRQVLDESEDLEVPLGRELELVQRYLEIEQIRFSDRLSVRMDLDPEATEALVPNLLLQPIVENALRHGVARRAGATGVTITTRKDLDRLRLRVADDGPGFGEAGVPMAGNGTGIENTRTRLAQLYGDAQSLELENVSPQGAAVTITIPFRPAASPGEGE